jgi:hypothetical protein
MSDFAPPIKPPVTIDDPPDKKPDNWVDDYLIEDSKARKLKDWPRQ